MGPEGGVRATLRGQRTHLGPSASGSPRIQLSRNTPPTHTFRS